ncbi:MAG TPA: 4-hydroxy-tetrahydrodipicolinate reductase [Acidimicrobiales bacterium]|nr:4-hydroxy-tetrahydrodipicolinate reductase [Acidimicrobiales bacterium]
MRVGVIGAGGRMGSTVCAAVSNASDMELVAAVDPAAAGTPAIPGGPTIVADLDALADARAEIAVDFTVAGAAVANAKRCAEMGLHVVIGTTGIGDAELRELRAAFPGDGLGCVVAPNFAIGAVLMMRFAEIAAPWFETAEIIELHHDSKIDAPSGTAMRTAERMAAVSSEWAADPTKVHTLPEARGGSGPAGIRIHSVRLRGLVAHQEVLLGTTGQTLSIRHDSYDRESFMPGVLLAVREVANRPGLTVGLDSLLGL